MFVFFWVRTIKNIVSQIFYKYTSLTPTGAYAHCLQRCSTCNTTPSAKSKMATRGSKIDFCGLKIGPNYGYWSFQVATNVVSSPPPSLPSTAMLNVRAKMKINNKVGEYLLRLHGLRYSKRGLKITKVLLFLFISEFCLFLQLGKKIPD